MIPLRPYQRDGIQRVRDRIASGKRRIVFVMPTGAGKTIWASAVVESALAKGSRVLFVAHRRELIRQTGAKLWRNGIAPEHVGIVMAGTPARSANLFGETPLATIERMRASGVSDSQIDSELWGLYGARRAQAPIQVASIDTARGKDLGDFDLIIIDECHRALAAGYRDLVAKYPNAIVLGLTATPYRADGKGLGELFDDLVPIATPRELARMGFLVEPRIFTVPPSALPDLSGVTKSGSDYNAEELESAVDTGKLVGDIVDHWLARAEGERTVVFASSVKHSRNIAESFAAKGVRAEHLDGETPAGERDAILARLASGETRVVSNCGVLCEGWDMPIVACCVLARPTMSCGLYLQQAGRILRPCPGKPWALILDHAGCVVEHNGGPLEEREFSLEPPKKKRKGITEEVRIKTCPKCFAIVPASVRTCPECGFAFSEVAGREDIEQEDGQLVEIHDVPRAEKLAYFEALCAQRGDRRPGWVIRGFLDKFGVKPPKAWKVPLREDESPENNEAIMTAWRAIFERAYSEGRTPEQARGLFFRECGFWPNRAMLSIHAAFVTDQDAARAARDAAELRARHEAADRRHAAAVPPPPARRRMRVPSFPMEAVSV